MEAMWIIYIYFPVDKPDFMAVLSIVTDWTKLTAVRHVCGIILSKTKLLTLGSPKSHGTTWKVSEWLLTMFYNLLTIQNFLRTMLYVVWSPSNDGICNNKKNSSVRIPVGKRYHINGNCKINLKNNNNIKQNSSYVQLHSL